MANRTVFGKVSKTVTNQAGGTAFAKSPRHALAQIATTNCFNGTYYADASKNFELAKEVALMLKDDPIFIAKTAVYTRTRAYMKDMPAFLLVVLANIDTKLFHRIFPQIVDNGKMLQNFCQIARSGVVGRTFRLGAGACRRAINRYLNARNPRQLFKDSIGGDFPLRDIIRLSHPCPVDDDQRALFAYLTGREIEVESLPSPIREYELFKRASLSGDRKEVEIPDVDFRMLDSLNLEQSDWMQIAQRASWTMTRMNLNTFARHGVFEDKTLSKVIAARLRNPDEIMAARAFPYQLMMAYFATQSNDAVPFEIREALQDAMEIAIENVPVINGNAYICVDTSGSMDSPITGHRKGSSSSASCVQVASLIASAIFRKNPESRICTFNDTAVRVKLNARDTVLTNTNKLGKAGGGTNCSAALAGLNYEGAMGDVVIYVSDYESWVDSEGYGDTAMLKEWERFQKRNTNAKLVCIDLTPTNHTQVKERPNILQVGGFGDQVFDVIKTFLEHGHGSGNHWVDVIEKVEL